MSNTGEGFNKGGSASPYGTRKNTLIDMSQGEEDQISRGGDFVNEENNGSPQFQPVTPPIKQIYNNAFNQHRDLTPDSLINEEKEYEYDEEYVDEVEDREA